MEFRQTGSLKVVAFMETETGMILGGVAGFYQEERKLISELNFADAVLSVDPQGIHVNYNKVDF